ncbi:MAG: aminopeptidase P family protein [Clostridiales Family XIII bacterium]|jgi:Xaa-Pro aminopeptidase|nr:aminopeptidase P family protein [Clostridiales Family XIII bacterium]
MEYGRAVRSARAVKGSRALLSIAKAAALGDACFSYILARIAVGRSERDLAAEIEGFLLENGAEGLAFPTICVSGERSSEPHGEPSDKLIEAGDFLTMDFGAVVDGYCGDMTRTVAVGGASAAQRQLYDTVLRAQRAALALVRAGARCHDVDQAARGVITEAGYGEYFIHGTGHGVGRRVHEKPTLNGKSDEVLEENMAVTVEPGIYIPKKHGVRIEDLAIVTKFGIINLTHSAKELIVV